MAYDEALASRVREVAGQSAVVSERKMFGGLCFMVEGNMACGVVGDELMLRVGPAAHAAALARPGARPMDFTGRPMKGMVYVGAEAIATDADLAAWLGLGLAFAHSLPPQ
jgi:TfoX/Sxy family transcriptional regulator of competence genes